MDTIDSMNAVSAQAQGLRADTAPGRLKDRLRAAGIHLLISGMVAGCVLILVYFGWYPAPLDRISGVGEILLLVLAVDVILGPLLTLVVFDRRKRSLPMDMACIALLQVAALAYGLHTVEAGRPHYLVFATDRFEVVSQADLTPADIASAADNPEARSHWFGPRWVVAEPFQDPMLKQQAFQEALQGGRDIQHYPVQYRPVETARPSLRKKGQPIDQLRQLNPGHDAVIDEAAAKAKLAPEAIRFVPVKGPAGDAALLLDAASGNPLTMVDLKPWPDQ